MINISSQAHIFGLYNQFEMKKETLNADHFELNIIYRDFQVHFFHYVIGYASVR